MNPSPSLRARLPWLESLHPGNFAMVMASGIISIGFAQFSYEPIAHALFIFAAGAWLSLVLLSLARLALFPGAVKIDLLNPRMVFSYFTLVAATDILGLVLHARGYAQLALACWIIAFTVWSLLLYLSFSVLTFISHEHNVNIIHGGWLISIVGTQSLVLLGTRIAPDLGPFGDAMLVEVHMLWGLGLIFYGIFVTLFCYRIFFLDLKPQQVSPLLWVIMGAAAVSANAGTSLQMTHSSMPYLASLVPFIEGVTLIIWAWGTWWIPMLFLFGVWKHLVRGLPLEYEPIMWSLVFPLGMYAVASARLGLAADFPPLQWIAALMVWIALGAWVLAFAGLARRIVRIVTAPPATE